LIHEISEIDLYANLAKFFKKNNYSRPIITQEKILKVEELRHPIHEYIEKDILFVPYTYELNSESLGILLYGMNSSGKSTLLKSLGLGVWLAQCGFYVPAYQFKYSLFDCLFTKIGSYDNLYCGHSTFVAEMSELNYILRKSTDKSLILCDELTSGTETRSATGIVSAALLYFTEKAIFFMITTHLHTVCKVPEIKNNTRIKINHFKVESEKSKSFLIEDIKIRYDRKLYEGSGSDSYGIEIAQHLGLFDEFVKNAFYYRDKIEIIVNEEDAYKQSRYNKNLFLKKCQSCGIKKNLHTHHITPQRCYDETSLHDKNGLYNLIVLCQSCHEKIHHQ
jgi:DNA mismatch repair protein MutS